MSALAIAVPAWAAKPPHPTHPAHPAHPSHHATGKGEGQGKGEGKGKGDGKGEGKGKHSCTALHKGYEAKGTLVSASLTAGSRKDTFDGSITVDVTRANHKAGTGIQTFTLTDARVRFAKGVDATAPAAGDQVTLHGKVTALRHGCSTTGFTPTITVRNVRIKAPKHA
jgi:hypothetical protein